MLTLIVNNKPSRIKTDSDIIEKAALALFRQSCFMKIQGYDDDSDALLRLSHDLVNGE